MNATESYQRAFAAHLRDPAHNPPPSGVDTRRISVYVDLLFNNVEDFLSNALPVTRNLLTETQWRDLVRRFYAEHPCQSSYFRDISGEFVQWLSGRFTTLPLSAQYPFLLELVHYEWVEIPLLLDDTVVDWGKRQIENVDWLDGHLQLNPVMLLQSYQYPVHQISAAHQPQHPEITHLLLLRNRTGKVSFIVLNAITARLLERLQTGQTARAALTQLAQETGYADTKSLLNFGVEILQQFYQQDAVLGTATP